MSQVTSSKVSANPSNSAILKFKKPSVAQESPPRRILPPVPQPPEPKVLKPAAHSEPSVIDRPKEATQAFYVSPEVMRMIALNPVPTLVVKDLVVSYGSHDAVKGINFSVLPGEVLGILGRNGAGKSSTMRRISGSEPPTSGLISVGGRHLTDPLEVNDALKQIGYCPDLGGLIPTASPREMMELTLHLHGKSQLSGSITPLLRDYKLLKRQNSMTRTLSHGEKRRLSVVLAVLAADELLILDEPFDGVDPEGTKVTQDLIEQAKSNGLAVVLSTHLQQVLAQSVDRVIVIDNGRIVDEGPASDFTGDAGEKRYKDSLASGVDAGNK